MTTRNGLTPIAARGALAAWILALGACSEPPPQDDARFEAVVATDRRDVPAWFLVRFELRYLDGRVYKGECRWPDSYTMNVLVGAKAAQAIVKPGKTFTSVRVIEGSPAEQFIPHGRGAMYSPNGKVQDGKWVDGKFTGKL